MPVNPRNNGYEATVNFKGERYRRTFDTKVEAEAWELHTKADLKQGRNIQEVTGKGKTSGPANLQQLLEEVYNKFWRTSRSAKQTRLNAQKCVDALGPEMHPTMATKSAIEDMVLMFESQGAAPATINRRLSAISKMLTHAYESEYITRKPVIKRQVEPEGRSRFISREEEAELVAYFKQIGDDEMVEVVIFGLDTGVRLGELCRVAMGDVNFEAGAIRIHNTKNKRPRTVPMTKRVREILERRVKDCEVAKDRIWPELTNDRVRHRWNHGRSHLKLMRDDEFVPHIMRHTFCSRLVQKGVSLQVVGALAGHTSLMTTMRYAHLVPSNLSTAIEALEPEQLAELEVAL